jgi:hypothetical protein
MFRMNPAERGVTSMTESEAREERLLAQADPTLRDAPPAPGSPRYAAILERAMTQTETSTPVHEKPVGRRTTRRWKGLATAGIGAAAATVIGLLSLTPGQAPAGQEPPGEAPSAATMVLTAAEHTGEADSLRAEFEVTDDRGKKHGAAAEFSGDDLKIISDADGTSSGTTVVIGDVEYFAPLKGGPLERRKLKAEEQLAPFADSAGDVVRAALSDGKVQNRGQETVRGVDATHYQVQLTKGARRALAALDAGELAWFELETPEFVTTVDIWVADDLVRRVAVQERGGSSTTTEFYDFGAPITITPPKGS